MGRCGGIAAARVGKAGALPVPARMGARLRACREATLTMRRAGRQPPPERFSPHRLFSRIGRSETRFPVFGPMRGRCSSRDKKPPRRGPLLCVAAARGAAVLARLRMDRDRRQAAKGAA